jgi:hypothetical protein
MLTEQHNRQKEIEEEYENKLKQKELLLQKQDKEFKQTLETKLQEILDENLVQLQKFRRDSDDRLQMLTVLNEHFGFHDHELL